MTAYLRTLATPDGPFTLLADEHGRVLASGWTDSPREILERIPARWRPEAAQEGGDVVTAEAATAVTRYYAGEPNAVTAVPVSLHGTDGQLAGWRALRQIAPGRPLTYTEFASEAGSPRAVRAAASVCARNPAALFVPCHRVLRADGSLGGFAWGTAVKRSLLEREERLTSTPRERHVEWAR